MTRIAFSGGKGTRAQVLFFAYSGHSCAKTFENLLITVTPAKVGAQNILKSWQTGFRRYVDLDRMRRNSSLL
jgi:hypothetical protein